MKRLSVILFILCAASFISCVPKNGRENESAIQNLSEEEIVNGSTYTKSSSSTRTSNNTTTISVNHFSGIERVLTFTPKNNPVEITVSSKISSGDLRIVICDDEAIIHEFEAGEKDQTFRLNKSNSRYYLKTVGDKARYTLEVSYEAIKTDFPSFEQTIL